MSISVPELATIESLKWYQADETANDYTKTVILRGRADNNTLFNNDILTSLREGRIGEYGYYAGHTVKHGGGGRIYDEIEITCLDLNLTLRDPEGGNAPYYSRFEAVNRTESRPLEEKITAIGANDETYALWWNHQVRAAADSTAISASDVTTLKAMTDLSEGMTGTSLDESVYYWAKTNQALKKGDKVFLDARFPGVQSYGVPRKQVKELIYTRALSRAQSSLDAVGRLYAPIDHTGTYYDSSVDGQDNTKWLITSGNMVRKTGWYEITLTYAFAQDWLSRGAVSPATGVYSIAGT